LRGVGDLPEKRLLAVSDLVAMARSKKSSTIKLNMMMTKSLLKIGALSFLAAALVASPAQVLAQSTNKPAADKKAAAKGEKKSRSIPFEGNIASIDKAAKTVTVGKRTFQITSETKIFKADKPALLEEGAVGDYVTGSYQKAGEEKLVAHSIYFGGKNKGKDTPKKKEKTKEK